MSQCVARRILQLHTTQLLRRSTRISRHSVLSKSDRHTVSILDRRHTHTNSTPSMEEQNILERVLRLVQNERLISDKHGSNGKVVDFLDPAEMMSLLPLDIDSKGCNDEEMQKISEMVVKYSVKTCHPHFYNQLYHGADEYGLAGSWLSDALNTNGHTFEVAPVFTIIEHSLLAYMRKLFGWGDEGDGIFSPGGSISNMYGMVLARHKAYPDIKRTGLSGLPALVALTSEESHYSIVKGANWMGLGVDNVVKVKTDSGGRMIPAELENALTDMKK